ncbi:hypothetical protein I7I53_11572 [Histoplasma capsulatum var. duboisii H88]|uniref:Uncharacterized protein n=1 Tax=Ajellomyces capsulatus (strain H88) TaxID=544711 RepID=A0A8A1LUE3_AJEC8|nr:hypothetical protein I7I53_11572 [Histoplasma capsulatum var. duboisii H88]
MWSVTSRSRKGIFHSLHQPTGPLISGGKTTVLSGINGIWLYAQQRVINQSTPFLRAISEGEGRGNWRAKSLHSLISHVAIIFMIPVTADREKLEKLNSQALRIKKKDDDCKHASVVYRFLKKKNGC